MSNTTEEAARSVHSDEGKELIKQVLTTPTAELTKANDLIYRAFKRPYLNTDNFVLILLANGWYFPTPQVDLFFESIGENAYKLMQKNSNAGFFLATYHNAEWTSGAGLESIPDTITVQDAFGTYTVKVETL